MGKKRKQRAFPEPEKNVKKNFVIKSNYISVFSKCFALFFASYCSMIGMIFARNRGTSGDIILLLLKILFALFLLAVVISMFMYKKIIVEQDTITYKRLFSSRQFKLNQIKSCMSHDGKLTIWFLYGKLQIPESDFGISFLDLIEYLMLNGVKVECI